MHVARPVVGLATQPFAPVIGCGQTWLDTSPNSRQQPAPGRSTWARWRMHCGAVIVPATLGRQSPSFMHGAPVGAPVAIAMSYGGFGMAGHAPWAASIANSSFT